MRLASLAASGTSTMAIGAANSWTISGAVLTPPTHQPELKPADEKGLSRQLRVPTLVLHGEDDALLPRERGRDTAMLVPRSEIEICPGWGHDIPRGLIPALVGRIDKFCKGKS